MIRGLKEVRVVKQIRVSKIKVLKEVRVIKQISFSIRLGFPIKNGLVVIGIISEINHFNTRVGLIDMFLLNYCIQYGILGD